ncbi:uncharacterized protein SPPG_06185 [Spizellomyces punctatus DAOM BR117]|uniref:Stress-response A/B barrel domain-containing protein n=1 Tax=Spizellomyces punctatus (strain DAOM BR117) TaxID=645134 RepID=A0A0L0HA90_SPIPD|nr:uncharacterized protein SPPG_06185 [Spizellomyces punctatus DAOM BR117]KNC98485.1 hypothetical protein SPPG_06185 [Spizellomyces punctatus DAOM BR117]|eukprot:XP_016606525.1 hypothetical protein SPPG_06185 [Spizellomyces punctatus DAOM BR117]
MTVTHIVLFKVKPDIPPQQLAEFDTQVRSLKQVPGVQKLSFGPTFKTDRARGYTHALVVELPNQQALNDYAANEHHVTVIKNHIRPAVMEDGILAMDIEQ